MLNGISFAGKTIYLESTKVLKDGDQELASRDREAELHFDKAALLKATDKFLHSKRTDVQYGFTTTSDKIGMVYTVISPELGPNHDKLMISEVDYWDDSMATKIQEISVDDFKGDPFYQALFTRLRDAIEGFTENTRPKKDLVKELDEQYEKRNFIA